MTLMVEIEDALDRNMHELRTNTPHHVLAAYLYECLINFEKATLARSHYYSRPTGQDKIT